MRFIINALLLCMLLSTGIGVAQDDTGTGQKEETCPQRVARTMREREEKCVRMFSVTNAYDARVCFITNEQIDNNIFYECEYKQGDERNETYYKNER
jgi:hypothetical protein